MSELERWEFAGWGSAQRIQDLQSRGLPLHPLDQPQRHTLGAWRATAIYRFPHRIEDLGGVRVVL